MKTLTNCHIDAIMLISNFRFYFVLKSKNCRLDSNCEVPPEVTSVCQIQTDTTHSFLSHFRSKLRSQFKAYRRIRYFRRAQQSFRQDVFRLPSRASECQLRSWSPSSQLPQLVSTLRRKGRCVHQRR